MTINAEANTSSPSTTWGWRKVKIAGGSPPRRDSAAGGRTALMLRAMRLKEPLGIQVRYKGGPSCSWEVRFRGIVRTIEGHLCWHDVMEMLYEERWTSAELGAGGVVRKRR